MAASVQLILARDVPNLGRIGDLVAVKAGYARNYLVPQGLAYPASPKRVSQFEHQKRVIDHRRRQLRSESEKRAQEIAALQVTLTAKVGEQGKLFGSITSRDIAKALAAEGHVVDHRDINLEGPLKSVGLHKLDLRLEADVTTQIKVVVAPEEVSADEAEAEAAADAEGAPKLRADGEPDLEAEEDAIAQGDGEPAPSEAEQPA